MIKLILYNHIAAGCHVLCLVGIADVCSIIHTTNDDLELLILLNLWSQPGRVFTIKFIRCHFSCNKAVSEIFNIFSCASILLRAHVS